MYELCWTQKQSPLGKQKKEKNKIRNLKGCGAVPRTCRKAARAVHPTGSSQDEQDWPRQGTTPSSGPFPVAHHENQLVPTHPTRSVISPARLPWQYISSSSAVISQVKGAHFLASPLLKYQQHVLAAFQINFLSSSHLQPSKHWGMIHLQPLLHFHCYQMLIPACLWSSMEITTSTHTPLDTHTLLQETPLPGGTRTGWESRGLGTIAIAQSHGLGALSLQAEQLHISAAFSITAEKEISWETK